MLGGPAEKRGPGPAGGRAAATRAPGPGREGPPPPRRGCHCAALQAGPLRRVSPSSPALPDVHLSEEPERRPGTSPSPPRRSTVGVRTGPRQPPQARASAVDRDGRCSVTPGPAAPSPTLCPSNPTAWTLGQPRTLTHTLLLGSLGSPICPKTSRQTRALPRCHQAAPGHPQ